MLSLGGIPPTAGFVAQVPDLRPRHPAREPGACPRRHPRQPHRRGLLPARHLHALHARRDLEPRQPEARFRRPDWQRCSPPPAPSSWAPSRVPSSPGSKRTLGHSLTVPPAAPSGLCPLAHPFRALSGTIHSRFSARELYCAAGECHESSPTSHPEAPGRFHADRVAHRGRRDRDPRPHLRAGLPEA